VGAAPPPGGKLAFDAAQGRGRGRDLARVGDNPVEQAAPDVAQLAQVVLGPLGGVEADPPGVGGVDVPADQALFLQAAQRPAEVA
jgi:hypothetical protein